MAQFARPVLRRPSLAVVGALAALAVLAIPLGALLAQSPGELGHARALPQKG